MEQRRPIDNQASGKSSPLSKQTKNNKRTKATS